MATKGQGEMCEAICRIIDLSTRTLRELGEAFGLLARLERQEGGDRCDYEIKNSGLREERFLEAVRQNQEN